MNRPLHTFAIDASEQEWDVKCPSRLSKDLSSVRSSAFRRFGNRTLIDTSLQKLARRYDRISWPQGAGTIMNRVLIIDDDLELCELVTEFLGSEGFVCESVQD